MYIYNSFWTLDRIVFHYKTCKFLIKKKILFLWMMQCEPLGWLVKCREILWVQFLCVWFLRGWAASVVGKDKVDGVLTWWTFKLPCGDSNVTLLTLITRLNHHVMCRHRIGKSGGLLLTCIVTGSAAGYCSFGCCWCSPKPQRATVTTIRHFSYSSCRSKDLYITEIQTALYYTV